MPQKNDYDVNKLLTKIARDYRANGQMIGEILFPRVNVPSDSGQYYVFGQDHKRLESDLRDGLARANRVDYSMSLAPYGPLKEHSLEQGVTRKDKELMGADKAKRRATTNIMSKITLRHEKQVADMVQDAGIITQNVTLTSTDKWSDNTGSSTATPVADVTAGFDAIKANGINGKKVLAMGYDAYATAKKNAALIALLSTASLRTPLTKEQLKALFDVDEIIVGEAMHNTAAEGQTDSLEYIWGDNVICSVVSPSEEPELSEVNPGYTLQLENTKIVRVWDEPAMGRGTEMVAYEDTYKPHIVAADSMYLIKDVK